MSRFMTFSARAAALTAALLVATTTAVQAAPVLFTNKADFQAAAAGGTIALTTETLDGFSPSGNLNTVPRTSNGITVSSDDDGDLATAVRGTGRSIQFSTRTGGTSITFTFQTAVNAIGIDIFGLGSPGARNTTTTLTLRLSNGTDQVLFSNFADPNGQQFGGAIDLQNTFVSATFTNTRVGDGVEMDNLLFGRVGTAPQVEVAEPGTLASLGFAVLALWFLSNRQRA